MFEIRNVQVFGLNRSVRAVGNSYRAGDADTLALPAENEMRTACRLGSSMDAHQSHDSFLKGVIAQFDMKASGVFMPEFQRYHFAEIVMSQSTMHSIGKLLGCNPDCFSEYVDERVKKVLRELMSKYDQDKTYHNLMRVYHNIPRGIELWCTVSTNYLQLKTICIQRRNHKLREEWGAFRQACLDMPMFCELTGVKE